MVRGKGRGVGVKGRGIGGVGKSQGLRGEG